jgi:hypothetical protein
VKRETDLFVLRRLENNSLECEDFCPHWSFAHMNNLVPMMSALLVASVY